MVLVVDKWSIPRQLNDRLCHCKEVPDFKYDVVAKQSRCKACEGFPPHIARLCVGCGEVFLLSFTHPGECSMNPLCWDCLNDPLCEDVINNHRTCGIDHINRILIEPPRFISKVKKVVWDGVSVFGLGEDILSVDSPG